MKTIFDAATREALIQRISLLNENNPQQWGKMNLFQMLKHCSEWDAWILGENPYNYKQAFLGLIFGKMALRKMIRDEKPFSRNIPTSTPFKVKEKHGDVEALKAKWIALIGNYANYSNPGFIHDFFGKMTTEQIGILAYKHTDHHLRQFNA